MGGEPVVSGLETAPLRFRVKGVDVKSVHGWVSNPSPDLDAGCWPMSLMCDCFVRSSTNSAQWDPDEGGTLSIQFEHRFPAPFVGSFGNRVHPAEFADDGEEVEEPDPTDWYHSKYLVYASARSAFPDQDVAVLHRRFRKSEGQLLEATVMPSFGGRVPTGTIEGGRIAALRFVEERDA